MQRPNPPHGTRHGREEPAPTIRRQLPLEDGREDLPQPRVPRDRGHSQAGTRDRGRAEEDDVHVGQWL